jgi:hypothetical protein
MYAIGTLLFLVALFHFSLYYWNMDFPKKHKAPDLSETKEMLETHLKELKQYSHG